MPSPFKDTSKATPTTPRTPRQPIPARWFFRHFTGKVTAPEGYVFNNRGDLCSIRRVLRRQERAA